jgi:hypothetical protein
MTRILATTCEAKMKMKFPTVVIMTCFVAALLCANVQATIQLPRTTDKIIRPDPAAVAVSNTWLAIVDAGGYTKSFQQAPARIRAG